MPHLSLVPVPRPALKLAGLSIYMFRQAPEKFSDGKIRDTIAIVNPTDDTRKLLESLRQGDIFHGCELKDKWDDGEEDTHASSRHFEILKVYPQDGRKLHTWFIDCRIR